MPVAVFPDTTVLCNFASVRGLDVLATLLRGRGRWTEAVAFEVSRSAGHLPDLRQVIDRGWLGEPIEIADARDVEAIERVRRAVFGGGSTKPLQHLGEAQTCYVLRQWPQFAGSAWVTDDREALRYARFQNIVTMETVDLVREAVVECDLSASAGFELLASMADQGRGLRLPGHARDLMR
ncbi:MAG: hypothetical protein ACOYBY_01185 [Dermatophilaceae bacterium]